VPTIGFKLLYGLAIIHLVRRRLVWTNATTNPTAEWIARQITEAIARRLKEAAESDRLAGLSVSETIRPY
jgi:hypothetical protein